jgi:hypothetical protein
MAPRLTPARRAILVAMASRGKPLVKRNFRWRVPDWGAAIEAKDVEALITAGCLFADGSRTGRVLRLTDFGRAHAEAASERRAAEKKEGKALEYSPRIIWGAVNIARRIGVSADFVRDKLVHENGTPILKRGGKYCAIEEELDKWFKS